MDYIHLIGKDYDFKFYTHPEFVRDFLDNPDIDEIDNYVNKYPTKYSSITICDLLRKHLNIEYDISCSSMTLSQFRDLIKKMIDPLDEYVNSLYRLYDSEELISIFINENIIDEKESDIPLPKVLKGKNIPYITSEDAYNRLILKYKLTRSIALKQLFVKTLRDRYGTREKRVESTRGYFGLSFKDS